MRYPASEKAEIIELVEQSHLPAKRTLDKLGIPRATFYRWYDRYCEGGVEALADHRSRPDRVWNRIPDDVRRQIIDLALELPELSPRELAVRFTDQRKYFVSEASVYRLLKAYDLITSPAYVVIKAADEFKDTTAAINQLWQTDFTYLKITGWGWYYLSTVLDDFSRYIVAWRWSHHVRLRRHGHARSGTRSFRPRPHHRHAATAASERQRIELRRGRSGHVAQRQRHAACARRSVSSPDPG
jgi:RNA-directed DNA polymerase